MKIRITKIEERDDAYHPNNIETGYENIIDDVSEEFIHPVVGECFMLVGRGKYFRSSVVKEIVDENTFKTMNSVYRWEKIDE